MSVLKTHVPIFYLSIECDAQDAFLRNASVRVRACMLACAISCMRACVHVRIKGACTWVERRYAPVTLITQPALPTRIPTEVSAMASFIVICTRTHRERAT